MVIDTSAIVAANYGGTLRSYGSGEIDEAANVELDGAATIVSSQARKNKPIWSAAVGYLFESGFGIEGSYLDLGTLKYRGTGSGTASSSVDSGGSPRRMQRLTKWSTSPTDPSSYPAWPKPGPRSSS